MIKEAIILAGGFGKRLQKVVHDIPKPMADINGHPFLAYLFNYLIKHGIEKVILSVGYKHEMIQSYFKNQYNSLKIVYSIEDEPLGTGGGIKIATSLIVSGSVIILNGDSFFDVDLQKLEQFHIAEKCYLTIALKPMQQCDRYGSVTIDGQNRIIGFEEKTSNLSLKTSGTRDAPSFKDRQSGKRYKEFNYINGGIYVLNKEIFDNITLPSKFSFETDLMEKYYPDFQFNGLPFDEYFIDIGIPEDYEKAKKDLKSLLIVD